MPQISIHRGKLHGVLLRAAIERLGPARIHTDCRLMDFRERADRIVAIFERRDGGERIEAASDALIGADGIHSVARSILCPDDGRPSWNGIMLWRGATEWPVYADVVEARAPDGFADIETVASRAEREAIVRGYASMAGYAREQVNRR
jgi:2-polyprenyl-6-methoxyphenol hydroxylase-like FAD-dependent oxidoreductase